MLNTQVQYFATKEAQRHNQAMEVETYRSNRANELLKNMSNRIEAQKASESLRQNALKLRQDMWNYERQASVNMKNAETNRLNAFNSARRNFQDWSLGLEANRISELNAQSNAANARSNSMNAATNYGNLLLDQARYPTEMYAMNVNAQANARNAGTNYFRALNEQQSIQNQANRYQWQNINDTINTSMNAIDTLGRFAYNAGRTASTISSLGG